ncbi:hypothetical protein ACNJ7E_09460 [Rhodococcus sp. NM-2]|uniref:hypothetical protein n=1 Tax=Rhodococcus sp. NM-2 TaxID=3401174 RepID=UPI003AACE94A
MTETAAATPTARAAALIDRCVRVIVRPLPEKECKRFLTVIGVTSQALHGVVKSHPDRPDR